MRQMSRRDWKKVREKNSGWKGIKGGIKNSAKGVEARMLVGSGGK